LKIKKRMHLKKPQKNYYFSRNSGRKIEKELEGLKNKIKSSVFLKKLQVCVLFIVGLSK